jgi:enoyl-CoA hydratase
VSTAAKNAGGADEGVGVEIDGPIATVTIDAPPVNAFTMARYRRMAEVFELLNERDDINCVILTATGSKAFSAGLDLHEFLDTPIERDDERQAIGMRAFVAVRSCPVPVIAAINGHALGAGMAFAALCDIRIASERATFGLPEINVGRCGGAAFVSRYVPEGSVRLMFFTGEPIGAHEAHRLGLVEQVVSPRRLPGAARELAEVIATKSPIGLRIGKKALNAVEGMRYDRGYEIEQQYSAELVQTEDSREALRALVERRLPVFKGLDPAAGGHR